MLFCWVEDLEVGSSKSRQKKEIILELFEVLIDNFFPFIVVVF